MFFRISDDPEVQSPTQESGPSNEFASFLRAHQDWVFSMAARLTGDDAQAEDIAQEVFLRAYLHFEALRHSVTARGWLKTVTTNLALNHLTRYRNRWSLFSRPRPDDPADAAENDAPDVEIAGEGDPLADLEGADRERLVEESLSGLPEHQRVPLVLYHFEELSYEDIAQQLRVSVSKVKSDIFRGRAALARILQRRGVTAARLI